MAPVPVDLEEFASEAQSWLGAHAELRRSSAEPRVDRDVPFRLVPRG